MEKPEDSYRGKGWTCFENGLGGAHINETDAANEIERLREENAFLKSFLHVSLKLASMTRYKFDNRNRFTGDTVDEAVRNAMAVEEKK